MFHPFEPFSAECLDKLISLNKIYVVTQTYTRAPQFPGTDKINLLFSDYDDPGLAKIHFNALKNDKYAAIVTLSNPVHIKRIKEIINVDSNYQCWWCIVKNVTALKKEIDKNYKDNLRKYILKHTTWSIGASEFINPTIQVIFGEIFISIKRGNQVLRVKFDQIENP